jgi:Zn-dependent peptidase ImmA (M78 family)
VEGMDANQFAFNILMPPDELTKEFIENNATIEKLKELADNKYNVSLSLLVNRLVDFADEKYAVVQSEVSIMIKSFPGRRSLVSTFEKVDNRSKLRASLRIQARRKRLEKVKCQHLAGSMMPRKMRLFMNNPYIIQNTEKF